MQVKCHNRTMKLHAVWDTGLIEVMFKSQYTGTDEEKDIKSWASDLARSIKNGVYTSAAPGWISCHSTTKPVTKRDAEVEEEVEVLGGKKVIPPLACPWGWATESNAYCCVSLSFPVRNDSHPTTCQSIVFSYKRGADICTGTYYKRAISVVSP